MAGGSTRLFLIQPLDAEPREVPEDAHLVEADDVETLLAAQETKSALQAFLNGDRSIGKLRRLLRPKS